MIDITNTLTKINCDLEDVLNVYKIVHNRFRDLIKDKLIKCDKIVTEMGYDKEWSEYYFNSRILNNLPKMSKDQLVEQQLSSVSHKPYIKLSERSLAVRELKIYKVNAQDQPRIINLDYKMPHQNGWFKNTPLPSSEFWAGQELNDENSDKLVMVVNHEA